MIDTDTAYVYHCLGNTEDEARCTEASNWKNLLTGQEKESKAVSTSLVECMARMCRLSLL